MTTGNGACGLHQQLACLLKVAQALLRLIRFGFAKQHVAQPLVWVELVQRMAERSV
jgi:hypothetical protein